MGTLFDTDDDSDLTPAWLSSAIYNPLFDNMRSATAAGALIEAPTQSGRAGSGVAQLAPTGISGVTSSVGGSPGGEGGIAPSAEPVRDGANTTVAATGDARIDGILSGVRWNLSQITYAFPANATDYESGYPGDNPNEGFGQLTIAQQAVYHNALNSSNATTGPGGALFCSVEGFTNQDILFVLPTGNATMRAAYSTDPGSTAYAYYPGSDFYNGDAWYGTNSPRNYQSPVLGGDAYRSTFHEIGHQLGLKHGHETGGPGNTALPADYNSHEFSVMTYSSYVGHPGSGGYTNETYGHPQSWMMFDIAALQYMYGADFTHNGGNTTYSWSTTTGEMFVNGSGQGTPGANRIFLTIWDGDGIDTFNLSNYTTDLTVDLSPGGYSTFDPAQRAYLGGGPNNGYARGNVFNALLYNGDERSLIENVIGGSGDDTITGNNANNTFTGNAGDDSLYGLNGNDALYGGAGDDYLKGGGGNDYLSGGDDDDTLKGGGDADTLIGGGGIDTASYSDSSVGVDVTLDGSGFFGTAAGDTLSEIENLTGSDHNDVLRGNGVANVINGGAGADIMSGGAGNDTYYVDNAGDVVLETTGTDTILTSVSYALVAGQSVETLATTNSAGTDAINLTGNELAQTLRGNAAGNVLDGGGDADRLYGFAGDDVYYVDNAGDLVFEVSGQGADTIFARASYVLAAGQSVEIMRASSVASTTALDLTGNEFDQSLVGNAGANRLDGGAGIDSMRGYGGDDSYFVDNADDLVFEAAGGGADTVFARATYVLAAGQSIEILRVSSVASTVAMDLTGNELAQTLVGNSGDNRLDGGGGADTMRGGLGDDDYVVDNAGDLVFETGNGGTDTVFARTSYALQAGQSVEVLRSSSVAGTSAMNLTGNNLAQSLYGNAGDNILDGGGGGDTMRGYGGDDTYVINASSDLVFEASGQGSDTVNARVSYVLAAGQSVETLKFTSAAGTGNFDLTGNEFAQTLLGNNGNNVLDGGGGGDSMRGYDGNDTYVINDSSDLVFESNGQGSDTINARVSYTLAAGQSVETLKFTSVSGTGNLNLTGNAVAQTITGNNGNNIIDGKGGADILRGYGGSDSFKFSTTLGASNIDHIVDFSAADDTIRLDQTIFAALGLGTLSAGAYKDITNGAAVDSTDRILYDRNTGALYYDSDGSGGAGRIQFAILDNKPAVLTNADFFVVA